MTVRPGSQSLGARDRRDDIFHLCSFSHSSSFMASSSSDKGQPVQDSASVLRAASFTTSTGSSSSDSDALTASDLLGGGFDPARLHPMAGLKDQLEYLQLDDEKLTDLPGGSSALPSRGWSDDLCYGTGTTYLSGEYESILSILLIWQTCSLSFGCGPIVLLLLS